MGFAAWVQSYSGMTPSDDSGMNARAAMLDMMRIHLFRAAVLRFD